MTTYKTYLICLISICLFTNSYGAINLNNSLTSHSTTTDISTSLISNSVASLNVAFITTTWNGTTWDNGAPDINAATIIDGDYTTAISGGFSALSLQVNAGYKLVVSDNTFVEVQTDVTVDGDLWVETCGAFVQVDDAGTFTASPSSSTLVQKFTSPLNNWYDYTYWSSPVSNALVSEAFSFSNPSTRYWFNAQNYLDVLEETANNGVFVAGNDDIDDNGDDWTPLGDSGTLQPGVGYATTHDAVGFVAGNSYQYIFSGTLNTGTITTAIYYNGDNGDNDWNFIGNPYPSAISVDAFFAENAAVVGSAIYLWSHATPASANNNGNEVYNYNTDDYAIINAGSGEVAGGKNVIPNRYIPSGQGFFVQGLTNGAVSFTNAMRSKDITSNSQFFRTETPEDNKVWVNLTTDSGVFNQLLVAYVSGATDGDDGAYYDATRNLSSESAALIYTLIDGNTDKKFAIQGKMPNSLDINESINLGFYTSITTSDQYRFSIEKLQGPFMTSNPIYLKDHLLNSIHNLSASDYTFSSSTGEFNERFEIVFNAETLGVSPQVSANDLKVKEIDSNTLQFEMSNQSPIKSVALYDALGRKVQATKGHDAIHYISTSNLEQAMYIAKVELASGVLLTKKILKQI